MSPKKKKKMANRSSASFKQTIKHTDKLSAYKQSSLPSTIMKSSASNAGLADRELERLVNKDVFRSDRNAIQKSNSNKRRDK